jgi:hypothetical protein
MAHRIDEAGNVANTFTEGNPSLGVPATKVGDDWLNMVQEEICNSIEANGVTLVKGTNTQFRDIMAQLFSAFRPGGRLTLTSATPVTSSNVTGATTVYFTPYLSNLIQVYDGTRWNVKTFTELSQLTTDATKSPAACTTNSNYDVFVWNDSGTMRATRGPAWTSDTARGTGVGTSELELFEGRYVNKNAITNGPAARRGHFVGTIRTDGSSQVNDSAAKRHVWNMYNRIKKHMVVTETTPTWPYNTNAFRQMNGSAANQLDFIRGLDEDIVTAQVSVQAGNSGGAADCISGVGLDSTTVLATGFMTLGSVSPIAGSKGQVGGSWSGLPGLGRHILTALENGAGAAGTTTWYGNNGTSTTMGHGIFGELLA